MARIRSRQPMLPSLLDRLIDEDPTLRDVEPAVVPLQTIRANLRRDLEWLLNTRLFRPQAFQRRGELQRSLVAYGLPDFSTVLLGADEHRVMFRDIVRNAIERFEPRLRNVQVELAPEGQAEYRSLHLRINALLLVEPDPVPLLFDSRIHAADRTVKLREVRHG